MVKSGFTQRRDDATKANKGGGLMSGKNYDLQIFVASLRRCVRRFWTCSRGLQPARKWKALSPSTEHRFASPF